MPSYDEYLRLLDEGSIKLEYCDGIISAMAGGTIAHAALSANATAALKSSLKGCQVFSSDLKVRVEESDLSTFPDVSAVCGPVENSPVDAQALTNPTILIEVTSRSTEDYDRGDKLSHYKQLRSLRAVLFWRDDHPRGACAEHRCRRALRRGDARPGVAQWCSTARSSSSSSAADGTRGAPRTFASGTRSG